MFTFNTTFEFLSNFADKLSFALQSLTLLLNCLLFFWLLHTVHFLSVYVRRWLRLKRYSQQYFESSLSANIKLNYYKECTIRYVIFLFLLLFEFGYSLDYVLFGLIFYFFKVPDVDVHIGHNCTLLKGTMMNSFFDDRPLKVFETFLSSHARSLLISFTWMYAALMLHLTRAASGKYLSSKQLIKWIAFGFVQHLGLFIFSWIPWTTFFALLLEPFISQFNFIVAVVLARRFLRAMESRVNMAYHTRDVSSEKQQRLLLKQYKLIIPFVLMIIGILYLKFIFIYFPYALVQTILLNPCLFYLPEFNLSEGVINAVSMSGVMSFLLLRILDAVCYSGLILLNIAMIFKYVASKCRRIQYRYHGGESTSPLLNIPRDLYSNM